MSDQLPLAFPHEPSLTAADFLPHPGARLALEFLGATLSWPAGRLALWGGAGVGKTHLLHIWAREEGASIVDGPSLREPFWPEGAVAVDDCDRPGSEEALLHVLNAAAEGGRPVLLAGSRPPARTPFRLPDLASRLRATMSVEIGPVDDEFRASLFARLLAERQLPVPPTLQAWMLTRLPRSQAALSEAVQQLDYAALAAKSGVTRALAAAALRRLLSPEPIEEAPP